MRIMLKFVALAAAATAFAQQDAPPKDWFLAGSQPRFYLTGIDPDAAYQGQPSTFLKSKGFVPQGFGTAMQQFSADAYAGKRVRLTAFVMSQNVERWAGLWMRVDGKKGKDKYAPTLAFDNMHRRPITGTQEWRPYAVVLDVPRKAEQIALGILLDGPGAVWMNSVKIEVVDKKVRVTNIMGMPPLPTSDSYFPR